jgi:hypothetical protein
MINVLNVMLLVLQHAQELDLKNVLIIYVKTLVIFQMLLNLKMAVNLANWF